MAEVVPFCRYRWLKREGLHEQGVEPCGECQDCLDDPPATPPPAKRAKSKHTTDE